MQNLIDPRRKIWVEAVVDPLPLSAIQKQSTAAQLCEVPADFGLTVIHRAHQLADAKLAMAGDQ